MIPPHLPIFIRGDFKTLPCYFARGKALAAIKAFSSGPFQFEYMEPKFEPLAFGDAEIRAICDIPDLAVKTVKDWRSQVDNYCYLVQFEDAAPELMAALDRHTRLISDLCDSRLNLDSGVLWQTFDCIHPFEVVHEEYRRDPARDAKYQEYALKLHEAHERFSQPWMVASRLIERIVRQIERNASNWKQLPPLHKPIPRDPTAPVRLFYSYSHEDEGHQKELEKHLSILRRADVINSWDFRCISAGLEFKGQIDQKLEAADIILLLVSASFLASDYCYDIEMTRALERHEAGTARVIPVILRPCLWQTDAPFAKLQALPKDGTAVTKWSNIDEAFTDIAGGIRKVATELRSARQAPSGDRT